jgi:FKBP-type peptidyl-prolyl cis-trans isomerase FkpA
MDGGDMFGRRSVLAIALAALVGVAACSGESETPTDPTPPPPTGPSTLQTTDLTVGTGAEAQNGNSVFIAYTVWRYDPAGTDSKGQQLDTNVGGTPFPYTVGGTNVIAGVSQGTVGMKVGGKRRLIIPPSLAYGSTGSGTVRPNEWLVFEFELLSVV